MLDHDRTPTYNLKVVVRETGLKPDTLRVWERRYGLPNPQRTAGGHRLYSPYDIATLKWLIARQDDGLSISRAVKLWEQHQAEGRDPLETVATAKTAATSNVSQIQIGEALNDLRQSWIDACLAFNQRQAEQVLSQAFALHAVEIVCKELLLKGIAQIGMGWYEGAVSVQQEHFASALAIRRLEALLAASPSPTRPERILVTCPAEEEHTFAPLMVSLFLRRRGWEVIYLGAKVPTQRFSATIIKISPNMVILSAQLLPTAATLLEMANLLVELEVPMAFGGLIFNRLPNLPDRIPGHFLGNDLTAVPDLLETWFARPNRLVIPPAQVKKNGHIETLNAFKGCRSIIEADMWQQMEEIQMQAANLTDANRFLARDIIAALTLGDLKFVNAEIDWVNEMLRHHNLPSDTLGKYLRTYHKTAAKYLPKAGTPIVDWLSETIQEDNL